MLSSEAGRMTIALWIYTVRMNSDQLVLFSIENIETYVVSDTTRMFPEDASNASPWHQRSKQPAPSIFLLGRRSWAWLGGRKQAPILSPARCPLARAWCGRAGPAGARCRWLKTETASDPLPCRHGYHRANLLSSVPRWAPDGSGNLNQT